MDTIRNSIEAYRSEIMKLGFSGKRLLKANTALAQIEAMHDAEGSISISQLIVRSYEESIRKRLKGDLIGRYCANELLSTAQQFIVFCQTGAFVPAYLVLPHTPLSEYYDEVINCYVEQVATNNQQKKQRAYGPRRYAKWLLEHGVKTFSEANVMDLRNYLVDELSKLKSKTIPSLRSELRRFSQWLCDHGYTGNSHEALFDFRVAIERKIHPAALPDDVAKVLGVIDRTTLAGKRDYAMILMAVVLGLRSCDIANLKLDDIDWRHGEIQLSQTKTGKPLSLPLTTDVAQAIREYILESRPQSDFPYVFLTLTPPFTPVSRGSIAGFRYTMYKKRANVQGENGTYPLRRALGRNLVVSGVPVTMVSQVLGHSDISNTKQYIALDTEHLKVCALDFEGIVPGRWLNET